MMQAAQTNKATVKPMNFEWLKALAFVFALMLIMQCAFPLGAMLSANAGKEETLFTILTDQYKIVSLGIGRDIARVRFDYSMKAIEENAQNIEAAGESFGIPPQIIASVLLKEQFTQSAPDFMVVALAPFRDGRGSTGMGAVTADTAKKAYAYFGLSDKLPSTDQDILRLFMESEEEAIFATACVLAYEARGFGYGTQDDLSGLTLNQWHRVYNKYNGEKVYADKTIEYVPVFGSLFEEVKAGSF